MIDSLGAVIRPWLMTYDELGGVDFNSSHVDQFQVSYFPYPIWRDESMHDLIVRVAKSAAQAVTSSDWPIRMAEHVMLRVDIALTRQGNVVRPSEFCLACCCSYLSERESAVTAHHKCYLLQDLVLSWPM